MLVHQAGRKGTLAEDIGPGDLLFLFPGRDVFLERDAALPYQMAAAAHAVAQGARLGRIGHADIVGEAAAQFVGLDIAAEIDVFPYHAGGRGNVDALPDFMDGVRRRQRERGAGPWRCRSILRSVPGPCPARKRMRISTARTGRTARSDLAWLRPDIPRCADGERHQDRERDGVRPPKAPGPEKIRRRTRL